MEEQEYLWNSFEMNDFEVGTGLVKKSLNFYFDKGRVTIYKLGTKGWNFSVFNSEGTFISGKKFNEMLSVISDRRDESLKSILTSNEFAHRNATKILAQMSLKMTEHEAELLGTIEDNIPFFKSVENPRWVNIMKNLKEIQYIEDTAPYVVDCATFLGSKIIDKNPLWCRDIGVPASGKSEFIKMMSPKNKVNDYVHPLSDMTSKSMVSGLEGNPDLYPLLDKKLVTMEEFTVIITKNHDELSAIAGQLRTMYGGHYNKTFGSGVGTKAYDATFGMLVGCTPVIDTIATEMGITGERFYSVRRDHSIDSKVHEKIVDAAYEDRISDPTLTIAIQDELFSLYESFDPENMSEIPDNMAPYIKWCAHTTAFLRVAVQRNKFRGDEMEAEAFPEIASRLVKVYKKLARIIAWMLEKPEVDAEVISYIYRVALDTPTSSRISVLRTLGLQKDSIGIDKISKKVRLPNNAVKTIIEDLKISGIIAQVAKDKFRKVTVDTDEGKKETGEKEKTGESIEFHLNEKSLLFNYIGQIEFFLETLPTEQFHHKHMSVSGIEMWKSMNIEPLVINRPTEADVYHEHDEPDHKVVPDPSHLTIDDYDPEWNPEPEIEPVEESQAPFVKPHDPNAKDDKPEHNNPNVEQEE